MNGQYSKTLNDGLVDYLVCGSLKPTDIECTQLLALL